MLLAHESGLIASSVQEPVLELAAGDWTPKLPSGAEANPADPYTPTRGATAKHTQAAVAAPGTPGAQGAFVEAPLRHRYHVQVRACVFGRACVRVCALPTSWLRCSRTQLLCAADPVHDAAWKSTCISALQASQGQALGMVGFQTGQAQSRFVAGTGVQPQHQSGAHTRLPGGCARDDAARAVFEDHLPGGHHSVSALS